MLFQNNPILFLSRYLWKFSKGNRHRVVLYFFLFVCANTVALGQPFVVAKIMNIIQESGVSSQNLTLILQWCFLLVGLDFLFWIFHGPARVIENANAFIVRANYKEFLLSGTLALPSSWHTDHHSGETIDRVEKGSGSLYQFARHTFEIIESIAKLVSSFLILMYFDVNSAFVVTTMLLITMFMVIKMDTILMGLYDQLNGYSNKISAKVFDVISNVTTVIILRIEPLVLNAIHKKIHEPYRTYVKSHKLNETKWFLASMCGSLLVLLVLSVYFYKNSLLGTSVTIGSVYLLYAYVNRITDVFFRFTYQYGDLVGQQSDILNTEKLSNAFTDIQQVRQISSNTSWKSLTLRNISFAYNQETTSYLHLNDISLSLRRGEHIALIGESGSGKSTFLKILRGLYDVQSGTIELDGKPLKHGLSSLQSHIALIPQDPEIFNSTIIENITMGVDHTLATVEHYTDMACFTDVVYRLPNTWESSIVEKGVNLSGGEKQRLALARGLMACEDKSIILLDEPTSSIDIQNEAKIYKNIFSAFKEKTIISSIHRLHLLHEFDTILFFKKGKIIAHGSFDDLLQSSPPFQQLWNKYLKTQKK